VTGPFRSDQTSTLDLTPEVTQRLLVLSVQGGLMFKMEDPSPNAGLWILDKNAE
jgi:hypothetical protein